MLENGAYNKIEILTQEPNKIELIQRNLASKIQSIQYAHHLEVILI